ncbi:centromere protein X-like isoform X2 [Tachypleus tridentatus]|uniref:centromere protein X-like isoform X2 n=1 Tax=Tachypleus tridentatus TaxID=6853 RepID=UPI003FD3145D
MAASVETTETNEPMTFKPKTIQEILKLHFKKKEKTRISGDALRLTTEVIRVFVKEASARAALQAELQYSTYHYFCVKGMDDLILI